MSGRLPVRGPVGAWPALRVGRVLGVEVLISWVDGGAEEWALAGSLGPTPRPLRQARGIVLLAAGHASCALGRVDAAANAPTKVGRAAGPSTTMGSRPGWAGATSSKNSLSSPSWPPGASPGSRSCLTFLPTHPAPAATTPRATTVAAIAEIHSGVLAATVNTVRFIHPGCPCGPRLGYLAVYLLRRVAPITATPILFIGWWAVRLRWRPQGSAPGHARGCWLSSLARTARRLRN